MKKVLSGNNLYKSLVNILVIYKLTNEVKLLRQMCNKVILHNFGLKDDVTKLSKYIIFHVSSTSTSN